MGLEDEEFFELLRALHFEVDYDLIELENLLSGYVEEYDLEAEIESQAFIELGQERKDMEMENAK